MKSTSVSGAGCWSSHHNSLSPAVSALPLNSAQAPPLSSTRDSPGFPVILPGSDSDENAGETFPFASDAKTFDNSHSLLCVIKCSSSAYCDQEHRGPAQHRRSTSAAGTAALAHNSSPASRCRVRQRLTFSAPPAAPAKPASPVGLCSHRNHTDPETRVHIRHSHDEAVKVCGAHRGPNTHASRRHSTFKSRQPASTNSMAQAHCRQTSQPACLKKTCAHPRNSAIVPYTICLFAMLRTFACHEKNGRTRPLRHSQCRPPEALTF